MATAKDTDVLLAEVADGDELALETLLDRYKDRLRRMVHERSGAYCSTLYSDCSPNPSATSVKGNIADGLPDGVLRFSSADRGGRKRRDTVSQSQGHASLKAVTTRSTADLPSISG